MCAVAVVGELNCQFETFEYNFVQCEYKRRKVESETETLLVWLVCVVFRSATAIIAGLESRYMYTCMRTQ